MRFVVTSCGRRHEDAGRSDFKLEKLDIEYIENWNLYLDVKILFKTFGALKRKSTSGK